MEPDQVPREILAVMILTRGGEVFAIGAANKALDVGLFDIFQTDFPMGHPSMKGPQHGFSFSGRVRLQKLDRDSG